MLISRLDARNKSGHDRGWDWPRWLAQYRGVKRPVAGRGLRRSLAAALLAAPSPALAWHDTIEGGHQTGGGGVPLDAIIPIALAVIVGAVALAIWGRKTGRKPHRRRRGRR